jgi:hypothetical protein
MEMNTEAEQLSNGAASQDHKRAENVHEIGGEVKRPREGRDDEDGGRQDCMDEDDEVFKGATPRSLCLVHWHQGKKKYH